jgi:hypothetical protein
MVNMGLAFIHAGLKNTRGECSFFPTSPRFILLIQ